MAQLIGNERVDDIPLLLHQMQKVNLSGLLDEHFTAHGNWQGISIGAVVAGWLSYILSTGDPRLNQVEDWAERIQETLGASLEKVYLSGHELTSLAAGFGFAQPAGGRDCFFKESP
jgi:hypothetical protein